MSIRNLIADQVNDRDRNWYGSISADDIKAVTIRKGCAEIDVEYFDKYEGDVDNPGTDVVTIDAAPVLTALLSWAMATQVTHDE